MTVYIDRLQHYDKAWGIPGYWCHMITDGDIEELHSFAKKIGMKRGWFQNKGSYQHYDIKGARMRNLALANGAVSLDNKEFVKKLREANAKQTSI